MVVVATPNHRNNRISLSASNRSHNKMNKICLPSERNSKTKMRKASATQWKPL